MLESLAVLRLPNRVSLLHMAAAAVVGLLLGAGCLVASPVLVLAALVGIGGAIVIARRPEIGLLVILVCTSSVVFEDVLPLVPIGMGSLHIPDLILLGLLGQIVVRRLFDPQFKFVRTPIDLPLLIFFGLLVLPTAVAILQSRVEVEVARREIRVVSYYLAFFVVTNLVRDSRQLRYLLSGLTMLATVVAAAMVAQFVLGGSVSIIPGRVEALQTGDSVYADVTRILPPGQSLVLVATIASVPILALGQSTTRPTLAWLRFCLLGLALLLTFNRGFWGALILAVLVMVVFASRCDRARLVKVGAAVAGVAGTVLLVAVAGSVDSRATLLVRASLERLGTFRSSSTLQESSLQWRAVENRYALSQIESHPLVGLGLGARYRPFDRRLDHYGMAWDATRYIHNGHLWLLLVAGVPGYLAFLWLTWTAATRGLGHSRSIPDDHRRAVTMGFVSGYLGLLAAAFVAPLFSAWHWTPVIGVMLAVMVNASQADRQLMVPQPLRRE